MRGEGEWTCLLDPLVYFCLASLQGLHAGYSEVGPQGGHERPELGALRHLEWEPMGHLEDGQEVLRSALLRGRHGAVREPRHGALHSPLKWRGFRTDLTPADA